jgi:hypothetical protein
MTANLEFKQVPVSTLNPKRKTKIWWVVAVRSSFCLGFVEWQNSWRKYTFKTGQVAIVLDEDCLREIATFVEGETHKQRRKSGHD